MYRFCRLAARQARLAFFVAACLVAAVSHADEREAIKLDGDKPSETVKLSFCNIFVAKTDMDDNESARVTLTIENLDESNTIILFNRHYPEKDLKKLNPSITFDKTFPGTKGNRTVDTYDGLRNDLLIAPVQKQTLPELSMKGGEKQTCRLPMYIATRKNKSGTKLLLSEMRVVELDIEVELKPDEDYLRLLGETEDLIGDLSGKTFCPNSRHKPSLERQEKPFRDRLERIGKEVDSIVEAHNWYQTDKARLRYDSIKQRLDSIDFSTREHDCGRHKIKKGKAAVPGHRCKYCNLSLQAIYLRLDRYYRKIDTSRKDRASVKASVMPDVELLYRCCTDSKCANHAREWNGSPYKSKIVTCYNRIRKL